MISLIFLVFAISWSKILMLPVSNVTSPAIRRAIVLFPEPDSPTIPKLSPLLMSKETLLTHNEIKK